MLNNSCSRRSHWLYVVIIAIGSRCQCKRFRNANSSNDLL